MHIRRSFLLVAVTCGALLFTVAASHADPSAAGAPPVVATPPAAESVPPAPATPPAQQQAAPADTEEDRNRVSAPKPPSIFQRASALLKDRETIAADIAQRDRTIADLRQQLAAAQQTIQTQANELTELRAGRDQLNQALSAAEGSRRTVEQTVASLGFDQTRLPAAGDIDQLAEHSIEGLTAKMKAETDPFKQAEIRSQIMELRDKAAKKKS